MKTERTPELYIWYRGFLDAHFWLPVFFLYFNELVGVSEVLLLESVYYFSVVVLEVPSGYFSDLFGRRKTLLIAAACLTASFLAFFQAEGIELLLIGQVLLASGLAFNSGTDTSLHYDCLSQQGRESEFPDREALVARNSLLIGALAALIGGLAASYSLRWAYGLSCIAAIGAFFCVLKMKEPVLLKQKEINFLNHLRECFSDLRSRPVAWIFAFVILMTILNHIPYMFYQPYLKELIHQSSFELFKAPAAAGLIAAVSAFIATFPAAKSIALSRGLGTHVLLIIACLIQLGIIGAMASAMNILVACLLVLRVIPRSLMAAPVNAVLVPRIHTSRRATFLSIQSLCGRVAFSFYLVAMAYLTDNTGHTGFELIQIPLIAGLILGFISLLILVSTATKLELKPSD